MAQLVEHWPEKPAAVAMDAGSNPICSGKGSFCPESAFSADSAGICTALVCSHVHQRLCTC